MFYAVDNDNETMVKTLIDAGADVNNTDKDGKTALFYAVENDEETIVEKLIDAGADVNVTDKDDRTAYFYAVCNNNETIVKTLIDAGADVNITDKDGETAFFYAVCNNNETMVKTLIDAGADVNVTNKNGVTVLFNAVCIKKETMVKTLIGGGADVNVTDKDDRTAVFYAVCIKNETMVETLINAGADVNVTDKHGKTALFQAVRNNNETMVKSMIDAGADVNITDKNDTTVLFHAVCNNNETMVKTLIDAGADVNVTAKDDRTVLFHAVCNNNETMVKTLFDAGADVNVTDKDGETAYFYAVCNNNGTMVKTLIDAGADVNVTNNNGVTVLFYAVYIKNETMVKTLIDAGADVNVTDKDDRTAVFYAVCNNNGTMVKTLIDAGADVNVTDKNGKTALFQAVCNNKIMVKTLIDAGAVINITDKDGKTVLFYALYNNNETMVETLIDAGGDVNITDKHGSTALFYAVRKDKSTIVITLIDAGADVNVSDNNSKTALFYAVSNNNKTMVKTLIDAGADVNVTDKNGKTALFQAVRNNETMVKTLIDAGADVNITDKNGSSALFYPVCQDKTTMVKTLIDAGVDVNITDKLGITALFYAVYNNNETMAKTLINAGADVNVTDEDGKTALFYTVQKDKSTVVKTLIDAGVDVNITDKVGKTALFHAVRNNNKTMVKTLIDAGADVNVSDKNGSTALFQAVRNNNETMVKSLINTGADANVTNKIGKTVLFNAVEKDEETMVKTLIDAGADVNITDKNGSTALFYPVCQDKTTMVKTLIDAGVDVNITDKVGITALYYAVYNNNETMAKTLIDAGADVNVTDEDGKTVLFHAVRNNNENVVRTLIDACANVNVTSTKGKTALYYAVDNDNESVVRALINVGAHVDIADHYGRTPLHYAITKSLSLAKYLLDKGGNLHLKDNCSVLTFLIDYYYYSLSEKPFRIDDILDLLEKKRVERKTIFDAIVSVAFCKILCFNSCSSDITLNSLSRVLNLAKKHTSVFEIGKREVISGILKLIKKEYGKKRSIESGAFSTILTKLNELGANPNTVDSDGNSALHYATQLSFFGVSQERIMEILHQLQKCDHISLEVKNHHSETPLFCSLSSTVEQISSQDAPCIWSGLKTQTAVCQFLVEHGSSLEEKTKNDESLLHLTLELLRQGFLRYYDDKKIVTVEAVKLSKTFLAAYNEKEISVNNKDNSGNAPLHLWASLKLAPGQDYSSNVTDEYTFEKLLKEILNLLLKNKARLDIKNKSGETPLHLCTTWTAVTLLLDAGANPNDVDLSGCSPLLVAAKKEVFREKVDSFFPDVLLKPKKFWISVLKKGLDPWTVDKHGESVLSILMKSESSNLARALLEVACDQNSHQRLCHLVMFSLLTTLCKDKSTHADWKNQFVEKILSSTKCPVNGNDNEDSPLHFCCRNIIEVSKDLSEDRIKTTVHWTIAQQLLSNGADRRIPDAKGQTCLDIAEASPVLKELLMQPIDLEKIPLFITKWTSVSKTYERYLAQIARGIESTHVEAYCFHKEHLKCGSFGAVFAGINKNDGREVAIKRIEKIRMQRPEDKRERTNLIALTDCEQVVRYLYFFEDENFSYIFLELMEGNLSELLDNKVTIETRTQLCQDVVTGLEFIHNRNILHRDLKPSNILFKTHHKRKVCLKIADFGLSRSIDNTGSTSVYGSGAGTRCWIAPEVLNSTKDHSKSSDIFACGLVLHYILSVKRHPFAPANFTMTNTLHVSKTESNILSNTMVGWDNSLPPEAICLIKMMLDSDDGKRPGADEALVYPFFWSNNKKLDLLIAVGNQPEFECPRSKRSTPLTTVETDLETKFTTIVKYAKWNDPGYVHMPSIYTEMTKKRKSYDTHSVVELVRLIRNAIAHVSDGRRPTPIRKLLLEDFVFLEYFPNLVIEVFKAVTTRGWDQREEIKYAINK